MNKKEIIKEVASILDIKQSDVSKVFDKTFEVIVEHLASEEEILISKFGKFIIKKYDEKVGRNPKTGETINIPKNCKILFKSSSLLKDYLNSRVFNKNDK